MTRTSKDGCTSCGSQDTATMDWVHGRRCAGCPPTFDATHAVELARRGAPGAAMSYIRTPLGGDR